MKSLHLAALFASAGASAALAASAPTHGAIFLARDGPNDVSDGGDDESAPLGPGASAVADSLRAAQANMQGRVDDGVSRYEDLKSENDELMRKNQELQQEAVKSDKEARRIKRRPADAKTDAERQLEGQISDVRASIATKEAEKNTLVESLHGLMATNQSEVIARRVDEVDHAKVLIEARFGKQRAKLQKQLAEVQRRSGDAVNIVQELQKQNEQMRTEGRAMQQQLEDLQRTDSTLRSEKAGLEKSVRSPASKAVPAVETAAAAPLQESNTGLQANIADLQRQLQDAQKGVEHLEDELKGPQKALEQKAAQTAAMSHLDDGSAEIFQSLKEENADLQRAAQSSRSDVKGLQGQRDSLEFDKDHLVATMEASTRLGESLKQELKAKVAEKDRELAAKDKRLAEQAHALEKTMGKQKQLAPPTAPAKTGPMFNATSLTKTANAKASGAKATSAKATNATKPAAASPLQAAARTQPDDPLEGMHKKAIMDRYRRRQMQDFSNSATAMAGEDGDGAADVPVPDSTTSTAKPFTIEDYLGDGTVSGIAVSAAAGKSSAPVLGTAQSSAPDDDVEDLLRQAQAAVNGETP